MKKFAVIFGVFFLFQLHLAAQRNCASMDVLEEELVKDPTLKLRMDAIEQQTNEFVKNAVRQKGSRGVITIPVVFHVVYRTTAENVSTAQLQSQLDVLNKDFRFTNTDKTLIPAEFYPLASDIEVEFCLATQTPGGAATTGIERKSTTVTSWGTSTNVKYANKGGLSAWDATRYLNIWVCNISGTTLNGVLGYATFPGGTAALDGVVVDYRCIGANGSAVAPYNLGRTATHEVGHWLNLRHIWGDANCGSDLVSDTPTHFTSNYSCPAYPRLSTCSGGGNEMTMNYMDYVNDGCMYMFTAGQKARMRAVLESGGARASLSSSSGCLPAGTVICNAPASISSSNVTSSSANISWAAVTGASSYSVEYKLSTATTWTAVTVTGTSRTLTNLTPLTAYNVRVRATCSSTIGSYTNTLNITTTAAATCGIPTNVVITNVLATTATCSWPAVSGATSYSVQYRRSSVNSWTTVTTTTPTRNLSSLLASTSYTVQVASNCSGTLSAYSTIATFTTGPTGTTCADNYDINTSNNNTSATATAINVSTSITAKISSSIDVDWFRFDNTSTAKNVKVTLSNLPADFDMILYRLDNGALTQVAISENSGTVNEVTTHNNALSATTYYAKVYSYGGSFNNALCYTLQAQISASNLRVGGPGVTGEEEILWEEIQDDEFMAFPNPTYGELTLMMPFGKDQQGQVRITDLTGKEAYVENFYGSNETKTVVLDVSSLQSGVYLIHYASGQQSTTRKIVIAPGQ